MRMRRLVILPLLAAVMPACARRGLVDTVVSQRIEDAVAIEIAVIETFITHIGPTPKARLIVDSVYYSWADHGRQVEVPVRRSPEHAAQLARALGAHIGARADRCANPASATTWCRLRDDVALFETSVPRVSGDSATIVVTLTYLMRMQRVLTSVTRREWTLFRHGDGWKVVKHTLLYAT